MQKYIILSILASCLLMSCNSINNKNLSQGKEVLTLFPLEKYDQNVSTWLNPDDPNYNTPLLNADTQQKYFELFYEHNCGKLSPWDQNFVNIVLHKTSPEDIVSIQEEIISKYSNRGKKAENDIGYAENYRPYSPAWADQITYNMNIAQFANLDYNPNNRGIAIDNLHARALPTNDVHFYSNKIAGQGYPFDNLQETAIWAGTPLYVVGTTMDKSWSLVITPSSFITWVESKGIARTSSKFIDSWRKAAKLKLGAITQTNTNIIDLNGRSLFTAYIGSVFPIVDSKDTSN
ncbi:SH3 domain-containing protein [Rickettsia bellii]|uniref:SH3 domain-containing protein n=1 Tax=Rickettsia bellii TaxID=33990 RepID=UPI0000DB0DA9|nr:SH3 domain-containing protein [Rickettsia bellii]